MNEIKIGMIVRYAPGFCTEGERKYLHIVKENLLDPTTGKMDRWLIQTLNTNLFLCPSEVVDSCMIEATSFDIDNIK